MLLLPGIPAFSTNSSYSGSVANSLGLFAGTYVDGKTCVYASSGTLLNCNNTPASTAADYITGSTQSSLSAEQSLGALTTGLLLNTSSAGTGTLSQYAGTSCTNQFPRSLSVSGVATCASVSSTDIAAMTSSALAGILSDETGTAGKVVFDTTPTLVTPVLGVATATSINKVAITAPGTSATLTIINGKTLTVNNSIQLSGTDSTTMTFPSTSATIARTDAANTFTGHQTIEGVASTGATGTGKLVFDTSPTLATAVLGSSTATTQSQNDNSTKVATTAYVDSAVIAQNYKEAVKYASIAALPSIVYANGSSGVGATLTGVALAAISLDSSSPSVNDRVLIKNQASTFQNGIYKVTATGSGIAVFVLTRTTDTDQTNEYETGDAVFVTAGSTLSSTTWAYTGVDSPTMGTDAITFVQTAGQGSFTGGTGIAITGTSIAIDTSVTVDKTTVQTLTNKRITKRDVTTTQSATPTINTDNTDQAHITGLAQAITSMTTNLSGTPVAGDILRIDITDDGTARAITWGTGFEASGTVALPTTTVLGVRLDVIFVRNEVTSKWRCIGVS